MKKNLVNRIVLYFAAVLCVAFMMQVSCTTVHAEEDSKAYKIMVNRAANCITVYEMDNAGEFTVPVKAFVCSTGREGHETPLGTFKTSDYYDWRLMVDGSYGQYAVRFNKQILFHSVPYYSKNPADLEWEQYNLLGQPASLGCVRLACADAKWIYDNCKKGTEVVVYDDAANPGPLGKPAELTMTVENPFRTWDPTDTRSENPWNSIRPSLYLKNADINQNVISLPANPTIHDIYGTIGVKDENGVGYELGKYIITLSGRYELSTPGIYNVSVCGIGIYGVRATQDMILHVY